MSKTKQCRTIFNSEGDFEEDKAEILEFQNGLTPFLNYTHLQLMDTPSVLFRELLLPTYSWKNLCSDFFQPEVQDLLDNKAKSYTSKILCLWKEKPAVFFSDIRLITNPSKKKWNLSHISHSENRLRASAFTSNGLYWLERIKIWLYLGGLVE